MRKVFADSCYWIALLNRHDQLHGAAVLAAGQLCGAQVVTTDEVLTEVLNYFSKRLDLRAIAAEMVGAICKDSHTLVVEQSGASFRSGLDLYVNRPDKRYSLTDCISFNTMTQLGITQSLSDDQHFSQAGFETLLSR